MGKEAKKVTMEGQGAGSVEEADKKIKILGASQMSSTPSHTFCNQNKNAVQTIINTMQSRMI